MMRCEKDDSESVMMRVGESAGITTYQHDNAMSDHNLGDLGCKGALNSLQ